MWIAKSSLQNVRSFEDMTIEFSKGINVLVGPNNSGKSTIAQAVLLMQEGFSFNESHIRSGSSKAAVQIYLEELEAYFSPDEANTKLTIRLDFVKGGSSSSTRISDDGSTANPVRDFPKSREPMNFIYPYLSKRKVVMFSEDVSDAQATAVTGNLQNLYAKVDKVSNSEMPAYSSYVAACKEILGFVVTCSSSPSGKKACYIIDNFQSITVDNMGEGVASILGLLVNLCVAENKLFVIEEPENDIHPKALKGLLRLIIEKSKKNQFIITTHSNIATRFLGAESGAKIFKVDMEFRGKIPTSKVELIENTIEARRGLLEELGYELTDLDLWEGWLFLEEASAEKIIREYLIPWFAPRLQGKLRTFSARSVDEIEPKFNDFNVLFSYLNLQPAYKNKAWVIVDNGPKEKEVIKRLKMTYATAGWNQEHFQLFKEHDFERYYPAEFKDKVTQVLLLEDNKDKRDKKKALLDEVESWIKNHEKEAKTGFEDSAEEVIEKLRIIETQMLSNKDEAKCV